MKEGALQFILGAPDSMGTVGSLSILEPKLVACGVDTIDAPAGAWAPLRARPLENILVGGGAPL